MLSEIGESADVWVYGHGSRRLGYAPTVRRLSQGLLCAGLAAAALAVAGCGSGAEDQSTGRSGIRDPGPVHVHGLGVNPKDGALFVASHTGLFRAARDEKRLRRVGDRFQDTMGFTIVGPDRFLGSGHPDLRDDLPPFLGLIRSGDAGRSWDSVSLSGTADFHVLESHGRNVYGFGSDWETRDEQLLASRDGGRRWQKRTVPESLIGLAIRPERPSAIIVSSQRGLHSSQDNGKSWRSIDGPAGLLAWPSIDRLYLLGVNGALRVSADAGHSWQDLGDAGGEPAAFEAHGPSDLYAALHDGTIKYSTDAGSTWNVRARP